MKLLRPSGLSYYILYFMITRGSLLTYWHRLMR